MTTQRLSDSIRSENGELYKRYVVNEAALIARTVQPANSDSILRPYVQHDSLEADSNGEFGVDYRSTAGFAPSRSRHYESFIFMSLDRNFLHIACLRPVARLLDHRGTPCERAGCTGRAEGQSGGPRYPGAKCTEL